MRYVGTAHCTLHTAWGNPTCLAYGSIAQHSNALLRNQTPESINFVPQHSCPTLVLRRYPTICKRKVFFCLRFRGDLSRVVRPPCLHELLRLICTRFVSTEAAENIAEQTRCMHDIRTGRRRARASEVPARLLSWRKSSPDVSIGCCRADAARESHVINRHGTSDTRTCCCCCADREKLHIMLFSSARDMSGDGNDVVAGIPCLPPIPPSAVQSVIISVSPASW